MRPATTPEVHPFWPGCALHLPIFSVLPFRKHDRGLPDAELRPSKVKAQHLDSATQAAQHSASVATLFVDSEPLPSMTPCVTLAHASG